MQLLHVVGTRPNFVKMAPVIAALRAADPEGRHVLVHTGQHYDRMMSGIFLEQLGVPEPDHMLGVGSGTLAAQLAGIVDAIAPVLEAEQPDLVIVPGDVNSTLAAALACAHLRIPIAHVEAGLRSFDRTMPEEVNRVLTDQISDLLFTHSPEAEPNLVNEGIDRDRVRLVGNTMIDSLVAWKGGSVSAAPAPSTGSSRAPTCWSRCIGRPSSTGRCWRRRSSGSPRSRRRCRCCSRSIRAPGPRSVAAAGKLPAGLRLIDPVGYLDFLSLEADAGAVLTDSGGIQEETTYLGVPCLTLRDNTERPITIEHGTNRLLGLDPARIAEIPALIAAPRADPGGPPPLWDGHAAERLATEVVGFLDRLKAGVCGH